MHARACVCLVGVDDDHAGPVYVHMHACLVGGDDNARPVGGPEDDDDGSSFDALDLMIYKCLYFHYLTSFADIRGTGTWGEGGGAFGGGAEDGGGGNLYVFMLMIYK